MPDDNKAFDEYFDNLTLHTLSLKLLQVVGESKSPEELVAKLHSLFASFNSSLSDENPTRAIQNFLAAGYLALAYYWNLSRRLGETGALSAEAINQSYREVNDEVVKSVPSHEVQRVRRDLANLDGDFTASINIEADL